MAPARAADPEEGRPSGGSTSIPTRTRPREADPTIVSLLPSATEMAFALGLDDQLIGVTAECDFPSAARKKPVVVRSALPTATMTPSEIDRAVSQRLREGGSLYEADEQLIRRLAPDIIVTQNLCQVCAPSGNELSKLLKVLPKPPKVLWQSPHSIEEIFDCLTELAGATGREERARQFVAGARKRIGAVRALVANAHAPAKVFMMEWTDPPYCSGHWVPEMIEAAGGVDTLARNGVDSVRVSWETIAAAAPETLVLSPCGYDLRGAVERARPLRRIPEFTSTPAMQRGRAFAVDSSGYFSRPGPRVVEGVELLGHLFHPDLVEWNGPKDAFSAIGPG
ncbi:MAG: cobalamin-binding protein [Solirubrobacterales bacterium]